MRPKFDGTFVGQRWARPGAQSMKRVSWTDRETGERRYGRVLGKPEPIDELVWDGREWVKPPAFIGRAR